MVLPPGLCMISYPLPDAYFVRKWQGERASEICAFLVKLSTDRDDLFRGFNGDRLYESVGDGLDYAFAVLLAFLDSKWDELDNPLLALEELVTDFRSSKAIWAGDRLLPSSVAGIGSISRHDQALFGRAEPIIRGLVRETIRSLCDGGLLISDR